MECTGGFLKGKLERISLNKRGKISQLKKLTKGLCCVDIEVDYLGRGWNTIAEHFQSWATGPPRRILSGPLLKGGGKSKGDHTCYSPSH